MSRIRSIPVRVGRYRRQLHIHTMNDREQRRRGDRKLLHRRVFLSWWEGDEDCGTDRQVTGGHVEAVIARPRAEFSARLHVGTAGSETPWDGHLTILGTGLYWGIGGGGKIADLLTRETRHKYEGRDLSLAIHNGSLWWRVWTHDMTTERGEFAAWREKSVSVKVLDLLLGGPRRYTYETLDTANGVVRLADGDYPVTFELQRQTLSRPRGPKRSEQVVEWSSTGIPCEFDDGWKGGATISSAFPMRYQGRRWVDQAVRELAAWVMTERARREFTAPIPTKTGATQ